MLVYFTIDRQKLGITATYRHRLGLEESVEQLLSSLRLKWRGMWDLDLLRDFGDEKVEGKP
jgi:hypothetical protein